MTSSRVTRIMSVSGPRTLQQFLPIKASSPNSKGKLLTSTLPLVVTNIDHMDKANNNHNRNIPRFVIKSSRLASMIFQKLTFFLKYFQIGQI